MLFYYNVSDNFDIIFLIFQFKIQANLTRVFAIFTNIYRAFALTVIDQNMQYVLFVFMLFRLRGKQFFIIIIQIYSPIF